MDTITAERNLRQDAGETQAAPTPPPLRLPTYLLRHLASPISSEEDVDRLVAHIRLAEWRGLL